MRDRHGMALAPRTAVWPPDDTEESVVGANLHQTAIRNLISAINGAAALATPACAPLLWQAGGQTMVAGFRHPDGSSYTTLPDVFVYPRPLDDLRRSLSVDIDGPPLLVIEVLSDTTHENDLDLQQGKGFSYCEAWVQEYLTLDPTGAYHPEQGQGWHWEGGAYRPWLREVDGRWRSRGLPLTFGLDGVRVVVFTADGRRLLREEEVERERSRLERGWAEERARREADLAELEQLRRRLERSDRPR